MRRLIHHETALSRMKNQSKQGKLQEDQLLANQCYGGTLPDVKLVVSAGELNEVFSIHSILKTLS